MKKLYLYKNQDPLFDKWYAIYEGKQDVHDLYVWIHSMNIYNNPEHKIDSFLIYFLDYQESYLCMRSKKDMKKDIKQLAKN